MRTPADAHTCTAPCTCTHTCACAHAHILHFADEYGHRCPGPAHQEAPTPLSLIQVCERGLTALNGRRMLSTPPLPQTQGPPHLAPAHLHFGVRRRSQQHKLPAALSRPVRAVLDEGHALLWRQPADLHCPKAHTRACTPAWYAFGPRECTCAHKHAYAQSTHTCMHEQPRAPRKRVKM